MRIRIEMKDETGSCVARKKAKMAEIEIRKKRRRQNLPCLDWPRPRALVGQGVAEDALDGKHLHLGRRGEGHLVKVRALGVANLGPVVAPVGAGRASLLLELLALGNRAAGKVSETLGPDDGDVELFEKVDMLTLTGTDAAGR